MVSYRWITLVLALMWINGFRGRQKRVALATSGSSSVGLVILSRLSELLPCCPFAVFVTERGKNSILNAGKTES